MSGGPGRSTTIVGPFVTGPLWVGSRGFGLFPLFLVGLCWNLGQFQGLYFCGGVLCTQISLVDIRGHSSGKEV